MKHILNFLVLILPFSVLAQETEGIPITRTVKVEENGKFIHFNLLIQKSTIKTENSKIYYWFSDGKIKKNVGGFSGDLLHGKFEVFNSKGELKEQGQFNNGLKVGTWKSWDDDGSVTRITKYVNGLKHGVEIILKGKEQQKTPYRMGVIHGKKIIENVDTVFTIRYRNGKELVKETKKEKKSIFNWNKGKKKKESDAPKRKQIPEQKD